MNNWQNYLSEAIRNDSKFNLGEKNEAISICLNLNSDNEIIEWSFHLTLVKCSLVVGSDLTEALISRKSKTRITSRLLKPIKEHIEDLDKILEIATSLRQKHILAGKVEIPKPVNKIEELDEFFIHNPAECSKGYFDPIKKDDCQTYISPLLHEANIIWLSLIHI